MGSPYSDSPFSLPALHAPTQEKAGNPTRGGLDLVEVGPAVSLEAWRRSRALLAAELGWGGLVVSWTTQGPPDTGQLGGVGKGRQVLGVRWASVSHPGVWALFPRAKEKGHLVLALCPHRGPAQSPGSF